MILDILSRPWPWYVSGPLIGLYVPILLLLGNRQLGMTATLRAVCAAAAPGRVEFFRFDWKRSGLWSIALAGGIVGGATLATMLLAGGGGPALSPAALTTLNSLGLGTPTGVAPTEVFSWGAVFTARGALSILGGGFLVGFGSSYAGGCTSGHGVLGLATRQVASMIALIGIFVGGLLTTYFVIPRLF